MKYWKQGFYDEPVDGSVEITEEYYQELLAGQSAGLIIVESKNCYPILVEIQIFDKSANVNSFKIQRKSVWLDKSTRVGLFNSISIEKQIGKTDTVLWYDATKYIIPIPDALAMLNKIEMYALNCYNVTQLHIAAVRALQTIEEIENYLIMASRYGFTKIFTSMFSVPGTKKEVFDYFKNFCNLAHKHGMKVSGDCNTAFFKKMGASESDISIFKEMGIDIIRMDLPYFDQRDVTLINNPYNITIELSSCMIQAVRMALENGANPKNFSTCHNFYPYRYTASDLESIRSIN